MMRKYLEALAGLLRESGDSARAAMVQNVITEPDRLRDFLMSEDLWGGSGSVADEAGGPGRSQTRREIERLLILIGRDQIRLGIANPRTAMWVDAFTSWEQAGV